MQNESTGPDPSGPAHSRSETRAHRRLRIRLRPSIKEILRQEARRRGADFRAIINIGLEEIDPRGRPIPTPNVVKELLRLATRIRNVGRGQAEGYLFTERAYIQDRLEELLGRVSQRYEERSTLWGETLLESRSQVVWVYLTPAEAEGLQKRVDRDWRGLHSLLQSGLTEGLKKRSGLDHMKDRLHRWHRKAKRLRSSPSPTGSRGDSHGRPAPERRARRGLRQLGREIDSTITGEELM